jgi:hypothetical protein
MGRTLIGGSAVAAPTTSSSNSSTSSSTDDPRKEGLPCIATWTLQDDNARQFDCVVYDSNGMQMGSPWAFGLYSSPSAYGGGIMRDKYFGSPGDNGNPFRTSSQLSTNSSSYMIKALNYVSHWPQHAMLNVSPNGRFSSSRFTSGNSVVNGMKYQITQVLPEGVRPRLAITRNGEWLYRSNIMWSSSAAAPGGERVDIWDDAELVSLFGQDNMSPKSQFSSRNQGIGACGYNERTKTFVIIWRQSGSTQTAVTKWKLTKNLNDPRVPLREVFESATSVETTNSLTMGWSGSNEAYRWQVTVGDNDYIRCSNFRNDQWYRTWLIDPDLALTSDSGSSGQYSHSATTSYGMEQGWPHMGSNYNSTWDNEWHIHYGTYYYYGCGCLAFFTSTRDPRLVYLYRNTDSSNGISPHAWGRTGFIFSYPTSNSDSSDHAFHKVDLRGLKKTTAEFDEGAGKYFDSSERTQPSVGSTINVANSSQWFPSHGYQSTNYPTFINVTWWPTADGRTYYSGETR